MAGEAPTELSVLRVPSPAGAAAESTVVGPTAEPTLAKEPLLDARSMLLLILSLFIFYGLAYNFAWIWATERMLALGSVTHAELIAWSALTGLFVAIGRSAVMMYIGYFGAAVSTESSEGGVPIRRAVILGLFVFAGIMTVYLVIGSLLASAGAVLFANVRIELMMWAGAAVGLFYAALGVHTLIKMKLKKPFKPLLPRLLAGRGAYPGFFLYGVGFGTIIIGCAFTVLFPLMVLASQAGSAPVTVAAMAVYAAPVAAANVGVSVLTFRYRDRLARVPGRKELVRGVSAVLTIIMGASIGIFFLWLLGYFGTAPMIP